MGDVRQISCRRRELKITTQKSTQALIMLKTAPRALSAITIPQHSSTIPSIAGPPAIKPHTIPTFQAKEAPKVDVTTSRSASAGPG